MQMRCLVPSSTQARALLSRSGVLLALGLIGCGVQELSRQVRVADPAIESLELGGERVAKEDVIAFLHFGHSNMAGKATGPAELQPYFFDELDPHAWMFHMDGGIQPAHEPLTAGSVERGHYAGPGTALVKQAAALAPDKHFISLGFGQSSAYCSQFLPGSLYYDSVMAGPRALKDHVVFAGIVVMLGCTERNGTPADISGYSQCIAQLVTAIRDELEQPDLPLLLTDYEREATGSFSVRLPFAQAIIPEIQKVPDVVWNSALVPTDGLGMQDGHHFNLEGHSQWVERLLQIMRDRGWFPWQ